jgi:hypothetical protein
MYANVLTKHQNNRNNAGEQSRRKKELDENLKRYSISAQQIQELRVPKQREYGCMGITSATARRQQSQMLTYKRQYMKTTVPERIVGLVGNKMCHKIASAHTETKTKGLWPNRGKKKAYR